MKNKLFILGCLILLHFTLKAQMKVGDNPTTINTASLLELESGNKGLVFPRVPLANVASPSPLPAGLLTGTMVYNTNAAIVNGNGTGLYLWGGSLWMSVNTGLTSATAWSLTGNAGTNYATNFIGTTDNVGFRVRTNNLQRILVDSLGNVAIGSTAFDPDNRERLLVDYGATTSHTVANFRGSINDFFQLNIHNTNSGSKASSDFVATADDGTDSTFYVDMGINSSTYNPSPENWGTQHDAYFYSNSKNLLIGTQADNSDVYFLLGGGQIKLNTALQIKGPSGVVVVGKGESTDTPVGNTIRGPNASLLVSNLAGGDLSLAGGSSTGSAPGGGVIIKGGSSNTGPGGTVYINTTLPTGNVRIGSTANNIIFPKFTTVGGLYYTSLASGQLSTTGANMTWDSIHNRLGIGTTNPLNALSVLGTNPLYLGGVQTTATYAADSLLVINAGVVKKAATGSGAWSIIGNGGLNATNNFIGTTDGVDFVVRTNNVARMRILGGTANAGWISMGAAGIPRSPVDMTGSYAGQNVVTIQNNAANGYSSVDMYDNTGIKVGTFGYANAGSGATFQGRDYFNAYGKDFLFTNDAGSASGWMFIQNGTGNIGINNNNPSQRLDIIGNLELNGAFMPNAIAGTAGQVLTSAGAGAAPTWQNAGGGSFIQNQTTQQASSNFNISGNGTIGTNLSVTGTSTFTGAVTSKAGITNTGAITSSGGILSVTQINPLFLSGVQATGTFTTDSILTINAGVVKKTPYSSLPSGGGGSGWLISGNNNVSTSNFLGTTDPNVPLIFKVGGVQAGYLGISSSEVTTFGTGASAGGQQSTALGAGATASQQSSLAVGSDANASSQNAIAIGNTASSSTNGAIALGSGATASSQNGIAIGSGSQATSNPSTLAVGTQTSATGQNATAIGNGSSALGNNSIVLGTNSSVPSVASNSIIIGDNLATSQSNVLILGNSSKTVGISTTTPNPNAKLDVNGPFKLGVSGSVLSNIIKGTVAIDPPSIGTAGTVWVNVTVTGATSGSIVIVNPPGDLPSGIAITYSYISAANTVRIGFINNSSAAIDPAGATYNFAIIQ